MSSSTSWEQKKGNVAWIWFLLLSLQAWLIWFSSFQWWIMIDDDKNEKPLSKADEVFTCYLWAYAKQSEGCFGLSSTWADAVAPVSLQEYGNTFSSFFFLFFHSSDSSADVQKKRKTKPKKKGKTCKMKWFYYSSDKRVLRTFQCGHADTFTKCDYSWTEVCTVCMSRYTIYVLKRCLMQKQAAGAAVLLHYWHILACVH